MQLSYKQSKENFNSLKANRWLNNIFKENMVGFSG